VEPLIVNLPHHRYPIIWENDLDKLEKLIKDKTKTGKHFVVTNTTIFSLHKEAIKQLFGDSCVFQIDDGEQYKNFETVIKLADELLQKGANRSSTLWAFGGGVVGDITGFLASIYMRGVRFYQVPTTLLSMVDSSVGGKTGVNLSHGKNMIGAFHQPDGVFIRVDFLKTLDEREFKSGLSEVIKSALLADPELFKLIEDNVVEINRENSQLMEQISYRSIKVKANVVMEDEKETGRRAILNLGHTLGHAIESYYNYLNINHGEAVSVGLTYAAYLSLKKEYLIEKDFLRIKDMIINLNMMHTLKQIPSLADTLIGIIKEIPQPDILINLMKGDKKNIDESIRFILLKEIGEPTLPEPVDIPTIKNTLDEFIKGV
jgi:3-dehydroquinate synthase